MGIAFQMGQIDMACMYRYVFVIIIIYFSTKIYIVCTHLINVATTWIASYWDDYTLCCGYSFEMSWGNPNEYQVLRYVFVLN